MEMKNNKVFKLENTQYNMPCQTRYRFHALSPRYDSLEECRVSYSLLLGGFHEKSNYFC